MTQMPPEPNEDIPAPNDPAPFDPPSPEIEPGGMPGPEIDPVDPGPEIPDAPQEEIPLQ